MTSAQVPLGVLDLVPISSGSDASAALCQSVELVRTAEALGYSRYWFAEHHLNPGVAGSAPAVMIALTAAGTERIRIGSGGVQSGHRTALSVVEEFGLLEGRYPGRIDLGVGRSGGRNFLREGLAKANSPSTDSPVERAHHTENGLLIPARPPRRISSNSPRLGLTSELLQQQGAESANYGELIREIHGLGRNVSVVQWARSASRTGRRSSCRAVDPRQQCRRERRGGRRTQAPVRCELSREPCNGSRSGRRVSRRVRALRGAGSALRLRVGRRRVGEDDEAARELATGYALWVRSIRTGEGAIPFPSPAEARQHVWSEEDRALVRDRVDTQFVGSPRTVANRLGQLRDATGADELLVTTITHRHEDRVASYRLLAEEWFPTAAIENHSGGRSPS